MCESCEAGYPMGWIGNGDVVAMCQAQLAETIRDIVRGVTHADNPALALARYGDDFDRALDELTRRAVRDMERVAGGG